ncbi:hypothetical protein DFH28DRAFT_982063 [Melampsora americana]|nr:hypothetical protein DFH28DRAFT_982063 [Melampsora americana]
MKMNSYSHLVFIAFHFLSSPGAMAHIPNHQLVKNHFETSIAKVVGVPEHNLEERCHTNPVEPVAEHVACTQSEYLKFIEDELMNDIDDIELNELQYHSEIDPTLLQILQPLHVDTVCSPQDVETAYHSHPSKRRKSIDTISTDFQVMNSNSRSNSNRKIPIVEPKNKQFVPGQSQILNSSLDTENNKNDSNLDGLNTRPHQGSGASRKHFMYCLCRTATIITILKWKGGLGMWHHKDVSKEIQSFFDSIDRNEQLGLQSGQSSLDPVTINSAIERVRDDVVMGFFGGLIIMLSGHPSIPPMRYLMADGWKFIQQYLYGEFYPGRQHLKIEFEHLPKPFNLLRYILSLKLKKLVAPTLIETLLSKWAEQSSIKPYKHGIKVNTHNFLSKIESIAIVVGKSIVQHTSNISKTKMTSTSEIFIFKKKISLNTLYKKPCFLLEKIGREELKYQANLSDQIKTFFKSLESEIQTNLRESRMLMNLPFKSPSSLNSKVIDQFMIEKVIHTVQNSLVTQVLGTLILLHNCQEANQIKEVVLTTGWEALKAYLSPWKTLFSKDPTSIFFTSRKKPHANPKWYDHKFMMHYYCMRQGSSYHPAEPMWFVIEIWYEMVIGQRTNESGEIKFVPAIPNRDIYNKIVSYIKTTTSLEYL